MTERESIINDIQRFVGGQREYAERAADWIISDRKRIVEPLVKFSNRKDNFYTFEMDVANAMIETLKNAGVE